MAMKHYASVDDYIADFPAPIQTKLSQLRQLVRQLAPQATEKISYGIPYYSLNGRLLYFAAFKDHISLFALPSSVVEFAPELAPYQTSKGTIKFPLDKPLPLPLIRKIIKFRVQQSQAKK
jgi:uncharacterized protein YdhG (YjbR/CyaY superfamily)